METVSIETRVAIIENNHIELASKHDTLSNRVSIIEGDKTNQALINQDILIQLKALKKLLENKKKEFNLWIPIALMMVFDIFMQVILPKL